MADAAAPARWAPGTAPIALFGGTFDPVHYGHLRLAADVMAALALPELRLVPAGDPPHRGAPNAAAADRIAMLELAVREFPGLVVDAREIHRGGKSYTVATLEDVAVESPGRPLALVVGADAFAGLPTWHRWTDLFRLANLVVVARPGFDLEAALAPALAAEWRARRVNSAEALFARHAGGILLQPVAPQPISATRIRAELARGDEGSAAVRGLLPDAVLAYIDRNRLYRARDPLPDAT